MIVFGPKPLCNFLPNVCNYIILILNQYFKKKVKQSFLKHCVVVIAGIGHKREVICFNVVV